MNTFKLPDLGEGLDEAQIVRWHVKAGDRVQVDDPMLALETAKTVVEVPSPVAGVIKAVFGQPGDWVTTGAPLVEFEGNPSLGSDTVLTQMAVSNADFFEEHVYSAEASNGVIASVMGVATPHTALDRHGVIGCTVFDDADIHEWRDGEDVTARLLHAIAEACAAEPGLNAWFDDQAQTRQLLSHVDVALLTDTPQGLMTPVIRGVRGRNVRELRGEINRLKRAARDRAVIPEELRDFTFTLSNFGMIAGRYATPVLVPPAIAVLGAGRISRDVVATRDGSVEVHPRMPLSLTFDHRCSTGGEAARFMAAVIRDLQKGN
jgi:2-oxoisovalerate dehydrogenase E2 component (dihydrolipoyl transacylase)